MESFWLLFGKLATAFLPAIAQQLLHAYLLEKRKSKNNVLFVLVEHHEEYMCMWGEE